MDKNKVVYFIISAILLCLVMLSAAYVPFLVMIMPFLIVGLSCVATQKTDCKFGFAASIISLVFAAALKFNVENILASAVYLMLGIVLSGIIGKKKTKSTMLITVGVVFVLMYAADFAYQSVKLGENAFVAGINNFVSEYNEVLADALKMTEFSDYISVAEEYVKTMASMVINLLPAIIIVGSAVMAYIVLCFASLFMKLFKCENHFTPLFSTFKVDGVTSIVYLISLIMSLFLNNEILLIVFMNIYTIIQFFLIVCGFSIFDYFLKSKKLNLILRILLLGVLFISASLPFVSIILTVVALLDAKRDFRNLTGNRKYIGFINGKPTILTQSQVEEILKKSQEKSESEENKEETLDGEASGESNENDNDVK